MTHDPLRKWVLVTVTERVPDRDGAAENQYVMSEAMFEAFESDWRTAKAGGVYVTALDVSNSVHAWQTITLDGVVSIKGEPMQEFTPPD